MILDVVLVIVGLIGLVFGGDWLVRGASRLAASFGVSALVIGLTIVAYGTSMPELLVNVSAALQGRNGLALGNVVGSNIANIGLILGISGLLVPVAVKAVLIRREIPLLIGVSVVLYIFAIVDHIGPLDGIVLVIGGIVYTVYIYYASAHDEVELRVEADEFSEALSHTHEPIKRNVELFRVAAGIAILAAGSQAMVVGATNVAESLGVSELVIGLTLVAVGTSLPELAASVMATFHRETDILVGNIIGSNLFNILVVLGLTSIIKPVPVPNSALQVEFPVMIIYAVVLLPVALNSVLARREGILLLGTYLAFVVFMFVR